MANKKYNVLFICTGNSARSIMAEAIMNNIGKDRFKAYSAGSFPRGSVHPMTLAVLSGNNYDLSGLRSKSWEEFSGQDAPKMDFVFTVCDQAAGEVCPVWPGQPITAHWGFIDPVAVQGDADAQRRAFDNVLFQVTNRIRHLMSLPLETLDRMTLQQQLRELGKS